MPPRILDKKQKLLFKGKLFEGTIIYVVAVYTGLNTVLWYMSNRNQFWI